MEFSGTLVEEGLAKDGHQFLCVVCGYRSAKRHNVKTHYRLRHKPQVESSCEVCEQTFRNVLQRDRHRVKAHGITKLMLGSDLRLMANPDHPNGRKYLGTSKSKAQLNNPDSVTDTRVILASIVPTISDLNTVSEIDSEPPRVKPEPKQ